MKESNRRWHNITLQTYNALMHDTLIQPHNITTESARAYTFEDEEAMELCRPLRGYFAMKNIDGKNIKYFIEEEYYNDLPIRINDSEEIFYKDSTRCKSVVIRPLDITPFRIKPELQWENNHDFIDEIAPFSHTHPDAYTVNKIVSLMAYIGKTFIGISTSPEFGKSSTFQIIDSLIKKTPVFQPRSVPGVLARITGDGAMIFDEPAGVTSEVRKCMENISLQVAGNSPVYLNGALRSKNTKAKYDVAQQSIVYLYNLYTNYSDPDKTFFDRMWDDKDAMRSRFLCMKFEGKLTEEFDKNFDIPGEAEKHKMYYIKIAKHLLYLKALKLKHAYQRRYSNKIHLPLTGRHKIIYNEITWGIDVYSRTQEEYNKLMKVFNDAIIDYDMMVRGASEHKEPEGSFKQFKVEEEKVEKGTISYPLFIENIQQMTEQMSQEKIKTLYANLCDDLVFEALLDKALKEGEMYESSPGKYGVLK